MTDEDFTAVRSKQFTNGDVYTGTWTSTGLPDGEGKYTWQDGSTYEGSWKNGAKHGIGKYTWPSGASYHGEWWEGAMQGVGTWESADGHCRYQGGWHKNVKHGLGRQVYGSGDVYEGLWKLGSHWGPGRYVYGDGNEYDGEWRAGRMHGHGTFVWRTGERYDGEWKDGRMHGAGVFTAADGSVYDSRWRRGRKHGVGIFRPALGATAAAALLNAVEGPNAVTRPPAGRRVSGPGISAGGRSSGGGAPPAAAPASGAATAIGGVGPAGAAAGGAAAGGAAAGGAPNGPNGAHGGSGGAADGGLGLVGTAAAAVLARRAGSAAVYSSGGGVSVPPILFPSLPPSAPDSPRHPQPSAGSGSHGAQPWSLLQPPPPPLLQPAPQSSGLPTPGDTFPAVLESQMGGAGALPAAPLHPPPRDGGGGGGGGGGGAQLGSYPIASGLPLIHANNNPSVNGGVNAVHIFANGVSHTAALGPGPTGHVGPNSQTGGGGGGPHMRGIAVSGSGAAAGHGNGSFGVGGGGKTVFVRVYDKGRLVRETAFSVDDVEAVMPGLTAVGRRGPRDERGPYQLLRRLRGGAMAAVGGGRPRLGDLVTRAHHAYALMVALQLGIRYSVGRISHEPLPRSTSQDEYSLRVQQEFPRGGSEMTPVHPVEDFTWSDYAPVTFRRLRELFGLDASTYMLSLCSDQSLRHLASPGKSGSVFFLSQDERFFIKTMSRAEMEVLVSMLPAYHRHVDRHPHTLLCRFFGLHCVTTPSGRKYRFVVMSNIFRTPLLLHRKYDLKGSTVGRTAGRPPADDPSVIFKDLDLDLKLRLEEGWRDRLLFQLRADCGLLAGVGVMDYSLLVGVHFRDRGAKAAAAANGVNGGGGGAPLEDPSVHPTIRLGSSFGGFGGGKEANPSRSTRRDKDRDKDRERERDREHPNYRQHNDTEERAQEYTRAGDRIHRLQARLGLGEAAAGDLLELARSRVFAPRCRVPMSGAAADLEAAPGATASGSASAAAASGGCGRAAGGGGGSVSVSVNDQLALSMGQSRVQLGLNMVATAVYKDGREEEAIIWFALIDILQPYNATKRLEHGLKSVIHSATSISVTHPSTYASRFQAFMKQVFE